MHPNTDGDGLTPAEALQIEETINLAGAMIGVTAALGGAPIPGLGMLAAASGKLIFDMAAPGDTPLALYFKALAKMIEQLETIMLEEFNRVEQQIQGLQVDILKLQIAIEKLGIQLDLLAYENARSVVNQYYQDFSDFSLALVKPGQTKTQIHDASAGMFNLLSVTASGNAANDVSIALNDIQNVVVDSGDDTQGLLSRQVELVGITVSNWVADGSHYSGARLKTPRFGPYDAPAYEMIYTKAYGTAAGAAICDYVIPLIRDILITEYRGLRFLTYAWGGTALQPQLRAHAANARRIIASIGRLRKALSADANVDQAVATALARTPLKAGPSFGAMPPNGDESQYISPDPYYSWSASRDIESPQRMTAILPSGSGLDFGSTYDSYALAYSWNQPPQLYGLFAYHKRKTTVPYPHERIPNPLSKELYELSRRLKKAGVAADGPRIEPSALPSASSGQLAGKVVKLKDPTEYHIVVFEVANDPDECDGGLVWSIQQESVAIGSDGTFSTTVKPDKALYWAILVVTKAWTWQGRESGAPPKIDADVVTFDTAVQGAKPWVVSGAA